MLFGILCITIPHLSIAKELQCEQDFPKIKRLFLHDRNIFDRGSFEDVLKNHNQMEYSELFTTWHPGKKFFNLQWMNEQEYRLRLRQKFDIYQQNKYALKLKLHEPTANFLLNNQELCILEVKYTSHIEGVNELLPQTHILVRALGSQEWRWLYIDDQLKEQDFREFFPNFPKNIVIKELAYTH